MLFQILAHTPAYVWGLLAALLLLGLWQKRSRRVAPRQLLALPMVLMGLGLWSLAPGFAAQPWVAGLWLTAVAGAAQLGQRIPVAPGTVWLAAAGRLQLPGSWMPLALILLIFCLRYAMGVGAALHPQWRTLAAVQAPMALMAGTLAGLSLGRTVSLLRLTRAAPATIAPDAPRLA